MRGEIEVTLGQMTLRLVAVERQLRELETWTRENIEAKEQARVQMRDQLAALEEVARAAGAIRQKINVHLQTLNAEHWLGPELRRLDAALKALEEP